MISIKGNNANYEGTSADTKPADVPVNTIFRELDTNCYYYYTGEAWVEIPGGGGGGGGGTDSYNDLENKPQINSVTLSGNKSLSALGIQGELTFDNAPTEDSTNPVESGGVYEALALKQDTLTIDSAPTESSTNPVESGGVYTALGNKQDTLTFNGTYSASTNPAATVSTVTGAISTAVSNLTKSDVGLDNVTNNAQIKAVSGSVTAGDVVTFGSDGATVQDSGKAVETTLTDSNNKIPTSKSIIDNAAGAEKLTGYTADTGEETIGASTTVTGAIEQLDYRTTTNKTNILSNTLNGGGINKLQVTATTATFNGITFTVNPDKSITATGSIADSTQGSAILTIGAYTAVSGDVLSEGFEEANSKAYIYARGGSTNLSNAPYKAILAGDIGVQRNYACVITADTVGQVNITFKPMICNSDTYAKSGVYQPYAMSNAEITAWILAHS